MKALLTIFVLIYTFSLNAQDSTFNKRYYDSDGSDIGSMMISPNTNNGLVVCGGRGFEHNHGFIMDIDSIGEMNWSRTIQSDSSYTLTTDVCTSSDSTIIVSGYNFSNSYDSIESVFCAKFNLQGDTLWTNTFQITAPLNNVPYAAYYITRVREIDSSAYILAASSLSDSIIKIVKIDHNGNVNWEKSIEGSSFELSSIHVDSDSTFTIVGSVNTDNGFILKIDQVGNLLWSKVYLSTPIYDIISLDDDFYALFGNGQYLGNLWLIKLNNLGEEVWTRSAAVRYDKYFEEILNAPPQVIALNDTLVGVAGNFVEAFDTSGVAIGGLGLGVMRWSHIASNDAGRIFISGNGPMYGVKTPVLYEQHFGVIFTDINLSETYCTNEENQVFNDTIQLFIDTLLTSTQIVNTSFNENYFIDSLPLIVDDECVEFLGSLEEQESIQVLIYPNITTGKTNFELSKSGKYQLEIIDVNGNRVAAFEINGSYGSFDLSNEPAGMYFYKVFNDNTSLTGKIIKR